MNRVPGVTKDIVLLKQRWFFCPCCARRLNTAPPTGLRENRRGRWSRQQRSKHGVGEVCSAINCTNRRYKCPGKSFFFRVPKVESRKTIGFRLFLTFEVRPSAICFSTFAFCCDCLRLSPLVSFFNDVAWSAPPSRSHCLQLCAMNHLSFS